MTDVMEQYAFERQVRSVLSAVGITPTFSTLNALPDGEVLVRLFGPVTVEAATAALVGAHIGYRVESEPLKRVVCLPKRRPERDH